MQIILDSSDYASVGIHGVDRDEFAKVLKQTEAKLIDVPGYWIINNLIGSVTISLYSTKGKCISCKKVDVESPDVDYCESCLQGIDEKEAEDRARMKREDVYDTSRGH